MEVSNETSDMLMVIITQTKKKVLLMMNEAGTPVYFMLRQCNHIIIANIFMVLHNTHCWFNFFAGSVLCLLAYI